MFEKQEDPNEYIFGEQVIGHPSETYRGRFKNVRMWERVTAKGGLAKPAFTTVGRWKMADHAMERSQNVFLPWIYFDIDNPEPIDSWEEAQQIIDELDLRGYDLDNVIVAFSGRKGFHVQVPSYQYGGPVFSAAKYARWFAKAFVESVTDDLMFEVDSSPTSPVTLIRLIGSQHEGSGAYKTARYASDFRSMSMSKAFEGIREHTPFDIAYPPRKGRVASKRRSHVREVCERMQKKKSTASSRPSHGGGGGSGKILATIREGLKEGQEFGEKYFHVGRENGAFILGCWLLERGSKRWAWNRLKEWNNRNVPPLPQERLRVQFKGSQRKLDMR